MQDSKDISILGFLDDDETKRDVLLMVKNICPNKLGSLIIKKDISLVLLAFPSIQEERNEIIKNLLKQNC